MIVPFALRRTLAIGLTLLGVAALILAFAELGSALQGHRPAWIAFAALVAVALLALVAAFRLRRPRSRAFVTGHIVLFETPMPGVPVGQTPALTIRGARDEIERFIPLAEFNPLFGGYAIWSPASRPTPELPGEALGVWSRRTCQRFRRILRERGATIDLRREPGPPQRIARWATR